MKRTYVMPLVVLTVICLVASVALALMNNVTSSVITDASNRRAKQAMSEKIPDATGFDPIDLELYETMPSTIKEIYKTTNDIGYIFIAAAGGFNGDITVICGIDPNGRIISTSTLSHTETVGIGTIIEQESFLSTFTGLDNALEGIDTVTGATISTRAYIRIINDIQAAFVIISGS